MLPSPHACVHQVTCSEWAKRLGRAVAKTLSELLEVVMAGFDRLTLSNSLKTTREDLGLLGDMLEVGRGGQVMRGLGQARGRTWACWATRWR